MGRILVHRWEMSKKFTQQRDRLFSPTEVIDV